MLRTNNSSGHTCRMHVDFKVKPWYALIFYTLKTPGSARPGKGSIGAKLHSGSTMTRKSVNLTWNMTQIWVNLTSLFVNLTDFRVIVDPEWSLAPDGPFSGSRLTRVFLECRAMTRLVDFLQVSAILYFISWMNVYKLQDKDCYESPTNRIVKWTVEFSFFLLLVLLHMKLNVIIYPVWLQNKIKALLQKGWFNVVKISDTCLTEGRSCELKCLCLQWTLIMNHWTSRWPLAWSI